jgi:hypothetical protein
VVRNATIKLNNIGTSKRTKGKVQGSRFGQTDHSMKVNGRLIKLMAKEG